MSSFDLYVDSASNIPQEISIKRNIKVIPFTYTHDGEEHTCYYEDMPLESLAKAYYALIEAGAEIKTSLVPTERIVTACEESAKAGRDIVFIAISSGVSGTYNQVLEAKKQIEEKYKVKFYAIDSANAGLGEGLLTLRCADLRDMGQSAESCAKWCVENAYKFNSYVTVGDLKYLRRSGRISAAVAIAGTLLNIKPIIKADGSANAKLVSHGKERGRKRAIEALADIFSARAENPESNTVAIAHADCLEDAKILENMIRERGAKDIIIEYYDLCTGSHVGPGTLALFFYGEDRKAAATEAAQKKTGLAAPLKNRV